MRESPAASAYSQTQPLRLGDRADVVVLDPRRLDASLDHYAEEPVSQYGGLSRMVNRNDETMSAVLVGGRAVYLDGALTPAVGSERTGRFLRAAHKAPAPPTRQETGKATTLTAGTGTATTGKEALAHVN